MHKWIKDHIFVILSHKMYEHTIILTNTSLREITSTILFSLKLKETTSTL